MPIKPSTVETWVWVLVYGGLLSVSVGVFLLRGGTAGLGWAFVALGTVAALAGAAGVVLRSRMTGSGSHTDDADPHR